MSWKDKRAIDAIFADIKQNKFFWSQTLYNRFNKNPLLSIYLIIWAWIQTFLVYKLKIKRPFVKVDTFWGDKIVMILPHPTFLYFFGILGRNEIFLTDFIINNLKPCDVFIDGGANIGYYSLMAAKIVGNKGCVHSFEPTPIVFSLLEKNTHHYNNTFPHELALWDKKEKIQFTDFGLNFSLYNSITDLSDLPDEHIAKKDSKVIKSISVNAITLDEYCECNNVHPNFIKLDTEGSELNAIIGAENVISKYKPIISIEVWEYSIVNGDFKKIFELLSRQSYYCFQLGEDFKLISLCSSEDKFDHRFFNVVFTPHKYPVTSACGMPRRKKYL